MIMDPLDYYRKYNQSAVEENASNKSLAYHLVGECFLNFSKLL